MKNLETTNKNLIKSLIQSDFLFIEKKKEKKKITVLKIFNLLF